MYPPPVQYARTSDGYDVALAVCGEGPPLLLAPVAWSHVQINWQHELFMPGRAQFLRELSARFRLVTFDHRGEGLSQRGVPAMSMEGFSRDLEAVADYVGLDRFVLVGPAGSGHTAVRYAVRHPERVVALVLLTCSVSNQALPPALYELLPEQSWEFFVRTQLVPGLTPEQIDRGLELLSQTTTRENWLTSWPVLAHSDVGELLPALDVPTLVIHPREAVLLAASESSRLAASIRGARLVTVDGKGPYGDPAQTAATIARFAAEAEEIGREGAPHAPAQHGLSRREAEVLRLLAAGRSNQQIADELVISPNTVAKHVTSIFTKTGTANRVEATAHAYRNGLI